MRETSKIMKEIGLYVRKLPLIKQIEALDFIKWLWGGPGRGEEFTDKETEKIEALGTKRGGVKFKNWKTAKKYLEDLMK